jgi:tyrosine-protein kinase Etk/Wzc
MKKMQVSADNGIEPAEGNLFQQLFFRYWPYWPVFLLLMICCLGIGYFYLRTTTPMYESTATILIKDEKKGLDDSKVVESLNPLSSKKIVENETEIMRSRALMTEVVKELFLYAPITEKDGFITKSGYTSSPIILELQNPDSLKETPLIPFNFLPAAKTVAVNGKDYPTATWLNTPWGNLRFLPNPLYQPGNNPGNFYFSLVSVKKVAKNIAESVEVSPVSKLSTVIALRIRDASPARGEAILNSLMFVYNKISITDKTQLAANTLSFVEKRLKYIEPQLDSAERGIQKFRTEKGAVNLDEQSNLYLRSVGESNQKASELNVQLAALDQVERYVLSRGNQGGVVPASFGIQDPLLSQLVEKLYDSEIQYEKLKKTTAENNPIMISLQNEISKIKPNILDVVRNQRNSLEAGRNNLNSTIDRYSSLLRDVPKQQRELAEMNRPLSIKNNIYTFLLQKREEAALSFNATVSDSRLVDKAESSARPVSPRKTVILAGSLLAALVLGIGFVMLKEVVNGKILFRSDIESFSTMPVLGEIVYDKSKTSLLISGTGRSFAEEQFRQIRIAVSRMGNQGITKKIMVTSSIAGEGKSFVAANLALSFAATGRKVVVVDMDLYVPQVAGIFNVPDEIGITDYLNGRKEADHIIKKTAANPNLFVVPAGPDNGTNLSELLLNGKAKQLLDYLETVFDIVIVDTTPVLAITDAYVISTWCDASVYVIRHAFTPKIHVQRLDDNAAMHRLKNTGIVFNAIRKRGTGKFGYGYGYGYDYDYGYQYRNAKEISRRKVNV